MTYLGNSFDLHTGGIDNMFPHHENEIAQSEAATGESFVRYWMHCGHLIVDGAKMSKSLGNFHTLADLIDKGYAGREIRYVLLSGHYRQRLNFTMAALDGVRTTLQRLDTYHERLSAHAANGGQVAADVAQAPAWAASSLTAFQAAMDDDLNTPEALAALFDMVHSGNKAFDEDRVTPQDAVHALAVLQRLDTVFDILQVNEDAPSDAVVEWVAQRQSAREAKDFAESDRLRDAIAELGWSVLDTAEGPKLRRLT